MIISKLRLRLSRPARGAWVEMLVGFVFRAIWESRPARGAWVEILNALKLCISPASRPARGAWVEISRYLVVST